MTKGKDSKRIQEQDFSTLRVFAKDNSLARIDGLEHLGVLVDLLGVRDALAEVKHPMRLLPPSHDGTVRAVIVCSGPEEGKFIIERLKVMKKRKKLPGKFAGFFIEASNTHYDSNSANRTRGEQRTVTVQESPAVQSSYSMSMKQYTRMNGQQARSTSSQASSAASPPPMGLAEQMLQLRVQQQAYQQPPMASPTPPPYAHQQGGSTPNPASSHPQHPNYYWGMATTPTGSVSSAPQQPAYHHQAPAVTTPQAPYYASQTTPTGCWDTQNGNIFYHNGIYYAAHAPATTAPYASQQPAPTANAPNMTNPATAMLYLMNAEAAPPAAAVAPEPAHQVVAQPAQQSTADADTIAKLQKELQAVQSRAQKAEKYLNLREILVKAMKEDLQTQADTIERLMAEKKSVEDKMDESSDNEVAELREKLELANKMVKEERFKKEEYKTTLIKTKRQHEFKIRRMEEMHAELSGTMKALELLQSNANLRSRLDQMMQKKRSKSSSQTRRELELSKISVQSPDSVYHSDPDSDGSTAKDSCMSMTDELCFGPEDLSVTSSYDSDEMSGMKRRASMLTDDSLEAPEGRIVLGM